MATPDPIPNTPGRTQVKDLYADTLARLKAVITGVGSDASKRQASMKITEIQAHVKALRKGQAVWAAKYIPESYRTGSFQDEKILRRWLGNEYQGQFSRLHRDAAMVAAEGAAADLNVVADALERTYVGYVRRVQVEAARQAVATEIGGGIIEGASRQTVSRRLLDTLRDNAVNGTITVGKVTMNAGAYADLLARTVSRAARTEGTLNRLKENGSDLVIVSNTGAVDFCREYEDQIFSLSGRDSRFPVLMERPPYHPNCTHTLSAWIEAFAAPDDLETGTQFNRADNGKSASEMAKKYPQDVADIRTRTKTVEDIAGVEPELQISPDDVEYGKWQNTIHGSKYFNANYNGTTLQARYANHSPTGRSFAEVIGGDDVIKLSDDLYYEKGTGHFYSEKLKNQATVMKNIKTNPEFLQTVKQNHLDNMERWRIEQASGGIVPKDILPHINEGWDGKPITPRVKIDKMAETQKQIDEQIEKINKIESGMETIKNKIDIYANKDDSLSQSKFKAFESLLAAQTKDRMAAIEKLNKLKQ